MNSFSPTSIWAQALVLFLFIAIVRFILMLPLGLVEDEAYYWVWAQVPSAGYFDHTAGVGLAGWLWQQLFGLNFLGFRVLNGFLSLITGFASLAACLALLPQEYRTSIRSGLWLLTAALGFTSVLLGHVAWVPDALYLPLLSLAIWQVCRLLGPFDDAENHAVPKSAWAWAGLFFGLSILAKELVVLYAALFCIFALLHPRLRSDLTSGLWPWVGLGLIILGGIPTLIWNAQNEWILLLYQSNHAFVDRSTGLEWQDFGNLALAYALILGPAAALAWPRIATTWATHWPLWALFALPSIGFFYIALTKGLQTQWAWPSLHVGMLLLLPLAIQNKGSARLALLTPVIILTSALMVIFTVRSVGLKARNVKPVLVWNSVYERMTDYQAQAEAAHDAPVLLLSNRYQEASLLNYSRAKDVGFDMAHEGPAHSRTLLPSLNIESRSNHYDYLWPELDVSGMLALVIVREGNHLPDQIFANKMDTGHWNIEGVTYYYGFGTLSENPRPQLTIE